MNVGHGSALLSVREGEELGGYLGRTAGIAGSLDPLEVHAISFAHPDGRFVIVVLDVVCVNEDAADAITAALARSAPDVWVAATHTHSGPESGCVPGGASTPSDVLRRMVHAAVTAADRAIGDERPAALTPFRAWARGVANRRNVPDDPHASLPIDGFTVSDQDGTFLGSFVVSPIHPTVFGADNLLASADLTGGIRRAAVARFGGWAVVATGAAGDVSTRATRRERSIAEIDRLGGEIVSAVAVALDRDRDLGIATAQEARGQRGSVVTASTIAALAPNPDEPTTPAAPDPHDVLALRRDRVLKEGIGLIADRRQATSAPIAVRVCAASFDGFDLVALSGEPYLAVGESIRSAARRPVIVLGYTNGYVGYLPDASAPLSYETVVSPVRPESATDLIAQAVLAVDSLRGSARERKPAAASHPHTNEVRTP